MICPGCGKEIPDDSTFCIYCGKPISCTAPDMTVPGTADTAAGETPDADTPDADTPDVDITEMSGRVRLCDDGVYRWVYEYHMFKNPAQLFFLWRIFIWTILISDAVLFFFGFIFNIDWDDLFYIDFKPNELFWREILGVIRACGSLTLVGLAVLMILGTISYYIIAIYNKGIQTYLFEMDDKGVTQILSPKTYDRQKNMLWLAALTSLLPNSSSNFMMDYALLTKHSQISSFDVTRTVIVKRGLSCLHVRQLLGYNLIYTEPEDFDLVWDYIKARIPEKCKVRKF